MKDFVELLVKNFGFPEIVANLILLLFYIVVGGYTLFKTIRIARIKMRSVFIKRKIDQDLHPYFTHNEIVNYSRYYVPQYFQNIAPSEGDEPGQLHAAAARSLLMPEFLNKGLLTESPLKYFIILADTGMGKTAFLINLYQKYKRKGKRDNAMKYEIRLFPLGSKDVLLKIKKLNNQENTILLLDAFDEDIKAVEDYQSRMIEILNSVKNFRKIVFTCRTQFFPNKQEEPSDTDDITFGENINHKIHKVYLSSFDNRDIINYLFKKYDLNILKFYRAYQLVKKCPNLMFRPMLLTYIDDLIQGRLFYKYSYEMYEVLIDRWAEREALKPAVRDRVEGVHTYEQKLLSFSRELSVNIYQERGRRQGYFISIEELKNLLGDRTVAVGLLSLGDSTGRSLLNRNSIGQFKFSHKSILEYFLACELFKNPAFLKIFDFQGMDATKNFLNEMLAEVLTRQEGTFTLKNINKVGSLATIKPKLLQDVEAIYFTRVSDAQTENFAGLIGVKTVVLTNENLFPLYILYLYIINYFHFGGVKRDLLVRRMDQGILGEYRDIVKDVVETIPELNVKHVETLLAYCDADKAWKAEAITVLNSIANNVAADNLLDRFRETVTHGRSERAIFNEAYDRYKSLKALKVYLVGVEVIF